MPGSESNSISNCSTDVNGSWNQESILSSYQKLVSEPYPAPSLFSSCSNQILILTRESQVKRIGLLVIFNVTCIILLLAWSSSTQSMALRAYTYTVGFNLLSLLTCVLSIWVERNGPTPLFSFGYERFEVLAIFASTVLAQLGSLFIAKESVERLILEQPEIYTGRLMIGTCIAFVSHIVVIYGCNNAALDHVIAASSSSWLQEHVSDISQSICSVIPVLSGLLLPRINPMLLVACAGAIALFLTDLLIQLRSCYTVDTLVAISIATITFATMFPMGIYSGKVLLQTTPSHIVGQLDRCLRETLTIDGVLEFRNEHFWTLSFGKMAGSLQVRVRRDADEQLVLAHVVDRLSNLVSVLTVQVFKDDWILRKSGVTSTVPHPSAPLLPFLNSSPSVTLNISPSNVSSLSTPVSSVISNRSAQNGNSVPYRNVANAHSNLLQSNTTTPGYPASNEPNESSGSMIYSQVKKSQVREKALRSSWMYPTVESFRHPNQHTNSFHPDFSVPSMQQQTHMNNLLISGTRTLDANKFAYQPQ
ncbi:zinc transporter 6-like isoform X2 [Periplaneta americana]|uniref:zinc transporter 6-like isoform X2 n=1 Tax=Periplaneta americana TaxID=6978 RepID=UPI0037E9C1D7